MHYNYTNEKEERRKQNTFSGSDNILKVHRVLDSHNMWVGIQKNCYRKMVGFAKNN